MAFTGIAALVGAASTGAAVTATMVLAAVTEVGMALSLVGGITGNKKLLKIGGALSLIGGVGGLVAGATSGVAGAAGSAVEGGVEGALASASADAATAFGGEAAVDAMTSELVGGMEAAASQGTSAMGAGSAMPASNAASLAPEPTGLIGAKPQPVPAAQVAEQGGGIQAPQVRDVAGPADIGAPTSPADALNPSDRFLANGTKSANLAPEGSGSFFEKFSTFADKNKTLFNNGMQLVGGAFKGMNEQKMWDEKMALERDRMKRGNSAGTFAPTGLIGARA
jgi:hypothetical protein